MADVQRYRDPATGNLFTLTAEDAAKLGYELVEGEGEGTTQVQLNADGRELGAALDQSAERDLSGDTATGDASDFPRHVGGGVYELANGDRVRGKDDAEAAQAEIDAAGQKSESQPEA